MELYDDKRARSRRPHLKTVYVERLSASPDKPGFTSVMAHGVDISQDGISLLTPQPLVPEERVRLLFPMPDLTVNLPVAARVIWCRPDGSKFRSGLLFLS